MKIKIKRFDKSFPLPTYEKEAACFDLVCRKGTIIRPSKIKLVPVNIAIELPRGQALLVFNRSSTPMRKGLLLANGVGVIDPFYNGDKDEIMIELFNAYTFF